MPHKLLAIERSNNTPLYARLDLPPGKAKAYSFFVHCFAGLGSDADHPIITELVRHSIGVMSLDLTGQSNYSVIAEPTPVSPADIDLACEYLTAHYFAPQLLIGHSLACLALIPLVRSLPEARAIVSLSTPTTTDFTGLQQSGDLFNHSSSTISIDGTKLRLHEALLRQIQSDSIQKSLTTKGKPVLLIHAEADKTFEYHKLEGVFQSMQQPKSLITIDHGDHKLSSSQAAAFSALIIASWGSSYLFTGKKGAAAIFNQSHNEDEQEAVIVSETGQNIYQQKISFGDHHLFADRATHQGGSNTGPESVQLLLGALGSATSIAMREHAQIKGWSLNHVRIELRLVKNTHSPGSAIPSSKYIMLEINLTGNLDNIQRNALVDLAEHCALRQHLKTKILTRLQAKSK